MKTTDIREILQDAKEHIKNSLNYEFKNNKLLLEALTHSSFKNDVEAGILIDNQKLEFIGDSVLDLIASSFLLSVSEHSATEGEMTVMRSQLVKNSSLVIYANKIALEELIVVSESGKEAGINKLDSSLSDAFEALIGAMYLDSDFGMVEKVIIDKFETDFFIALNDDNTNYKGVLNELINSMENFAIAYELVEAVGPDHEKEFTSQVKLNEDVIGTGKGFSISESEQNAAKKAVEYIKEKFDEEK